MTTAISGTVLDPQAKPLAGVSLQLVPQDKSRPATVATTTSDAAGHFAFAGELPATAAPSWFRYCLLAQHPTFGFTWLSVRPTTTDAEVRFGPVTELRLPLRDAAGKPVPQVTCHIARLHYADMFAGPVQLPDLPELQAISDDAGICHFTGMPQGVNCYVRTDDKRFAVLNDSFDNRELGTGPLSDVEPIVLSAAGVVEGRVTAPDGQPAPGVNLYGSANIGSAYQQTVTDADGHYRLDRLAPGSNRVWPLLVGAQLREWTAPTGGYVRVLAGQRAPDLEIHLAAGVPLTCRVSDPATGELVANLEVLATGPQGNVRARTDEHGLAVLRVLPGKQVVQAQASTVSQDFDITSKREQTVTVEPNQPLMVEFQAKRWPKLQPITGRVLDPFDQPVAGAEVRGLPLSSAPVPSPNGLIWRTAVTAADGTFSMALTGPAADHLLWAQKGDLATTQRPHAAVGAKVELRLAPQALGTIETIVTDRAGQPLPNATVRLEHFDRDQRASRILSFYDGDAEMARTDGAGHALLRNCPPGTGYRLGAMAVGHANASSRAFDLPPGATVQVAPVVLPSTSWTVAGTVVDEAGQPAAGAEVMVYAGAVQRRAVTGANGRFQMARLPEGQVTVRAVSGARSAIGRTQTGFDTLVLKLTVGGDGAGP